MLDEGERADLIELASQSIQIAKELKRIADTLDKLNECFQFIVGEVDNGRFNSPKK